MSKSQETLEKFTAMNDAELSKEIDLNQRLALENKGQLEKHLKTLSPHDRLVLEAYAAKLMMQSCLNARLDHLIHLEINGPSERGTLPLPAIQRTHVTTATVSS